MHALQTAHLNNISWPSLYNPAIEVGFLGPTARLGGYYLSDPDDIFKFTLYWTLIFQLPFSFVAGLYAFFNFAFPPTRRDKEEMVLAPRPAHPRRHAHARSESHASSQPYAHLQAHHDTLDPWLKRPRLNPRRSRYAFALLVLLSFLGLSLASAVVGATVVSFVIVGVYQAGGFRVSTWVPFVWAVIPSLIALLEIWPSVIDIT